MEIREARPEDYEQLGQMTVDAYTGVHDADDLVAYAHELRNVVERARSAVVFAAIDGAGEVVGGVTYVPGPDSASAEFTESDAAGIRMLAVAHSAQRQGVGEALMRICIDKAKADGKTQIILHTTDTMATAQRLYLRLGFDRDASLDTEWIPGLWGRGYRLRL